MELFTTEMGWLFLLRWFHFLAGITWIGLLYYFNFVQTPFFAETEAPVRSGAIQKLVPRALWWFRWGAMITFLTGWAIIGIRTGDYGGMWNFLHASYGATITLGAILGTIMWFNVWFVIRPNQQVVIANAVQTAQGGEAIPEAAARGQRAGFASRTNTLLSIPLLFMMGAATHFTMASRPQLPHSHVIMAILIAAIVAAFEGNALVGTAGPTKKMLSTVSNTVTAGFVTTAVFYVLYAVLF